MIQTLDPEYYIKIGIKDNKIVIIDYKEYYFNKVKTDYKIIKKIKNRLKGLW